MKEFLISFISLVAIISLISIIIPNGKMNKVACICLSFIITLSLLYPLVGYYKNIDLKDFNENYNTEQEVLYEQTLYSYVIKKQLLKEEIPVKKVECSMQQNNVYQIEKVTIFFDNLVISNSQEHTLFIVKVKNCLIEKFNLKESQIYFNE